MRRAAAIAGVALVLALAATPAIGQSDEEAGYDFFGVAALADGITTRVAVEHFLAVEEFVALSSVSAEARLELARSSALAVLPDPGDLVLGLSGTAAALAGIAGLPDYPAVSRADYPTAPHHQVAVVPDADIGALKLQTDAEEDIARGRAYVTDFVDTIGVLPLTVGSIKADSIARRIDPLTYESTSTSAVSDISVLRGLLRIGQVASTVTARVDDGRFTVTRDETRISGVTIAGMPVAIDEKGITSPNGSQALAPLIESLAAPLQAAGVTVRATPGESAVSATKGTVTSGFLSIEFTTLIQNAYPAIVTLSFGKASSTVEASGRSSGLVPDTLGDLIGGLDLPGVGDVGDALSAAGGDLGSVPAGDVAGALGAAPAGDVTGAAGPLAASVKPMDFRSLYRWLTTALAGALVARWFVVTRLRGRDANRPNLQSLWRW